MIDAIILPDAEQELNEAADYYEARASGLGAEFLVEIKAAIRAIKENPLAYPVLEKNVRRRLVRRFPFGILYYCDQDKIVIVAFANYIADQDIGRIEFDVVVHRRNHDFPATGLASEIPSSVPL
jgi:plasmid stabilization system protein ParE